MLFLAMRSYSDGRLPDVSDAPCATVMHLRSIQEAKRQANGRRKSRCGELTGPAKPVAKC